MQTLCPNKEVCGSCGWSHIPYDKQLSQKLADINGSFALHELRDISCLEIVASPLHEHYRNRMDFVIDFEGRVGLRQKGKWWRVIDNHTCFLADREIERLFHSVREWTHTAGLSFFDRKAHTGILRYAVIRSTSIGETMINIVTSAPADTAEETKVQTALQQLVQAAGATTLLWSINHSINDVSFGDDVRIINGAGVIHETINDVKYVISPNAFFQTNPAGAALLQSTVLDFLGDVDGRRVADLYCGSGFFGIAVAVKQPAARVFGVEIVPEAIADAQVNAEANAVHDRIEWIAAKTEEVAWTDFGADVVIVDPPRSGLHDSALRDLLAARPERIVYISCNYKSFAREMQQLQAHYVVERMKAIDMFPHTPHVELVTALVRR